MSTDTPILCRVVFPVSHQGPEKDDLVTIKIQEEALLKKAGLVLNTRYEYEY